MLVNDPAKQRRQTIILGIILALLQLSIVPNIGIGSGRANLALVFVGCMCLGGDSSKAPYLGFFAGLFYDLSSTGPIGLMALLLTLTGLVLSFAGQTKVSDDLGPSVALFAPVAGVVNLIYVIVLLCFGQTDSFISAVVFHALPATILDILSFAIVGFIMSRSGSAPSKLGAHGPGSKSGLTIKRGL